MREHGEISAENDKLDPAGKASIYSQSIKMGLVITLPPFHSLPTKYTDCCSPLSFLGYNNFTFHLLEDEHLVQPHAYE